MISIGGIYDCICTYIDGYYMITNLSIAQLEILRLMLRGMSQDLKATKAVFFVSFSYSLHERLRVISILQPPVVADKANPVKRPEACSRKFVSFSSIQLKPQPVLKRPFMNSNSSRRPRPIKKSQTKRVKACMSQRQRQ